MSCGWRLEAGEQEKANAVLIVRGNPPETHLRRDEPTAWWCEPGKNKNGAPCGAPFS
jgi:hypothetical protein